MRFRKARVHTKGKRVPRHYRHSLRSVVRRGFHLQGFYLFLEHLESFLSSHSSSHSFVFSTFLAPPSIGATGFVIVPEPLLLATLTGNEGRSTYEAGHFLGSEFLVKSKVALGVQVQGTQRCIAVDAAKVAASITHDAQVLQALKASKVLSVDIVLATVANRGEVLSTKRLRALMTRNSVGIRAISERTLIFNACLCCVGLFCPISIRIACDTNGCILWQRRD